MKYLVHPEDIPRALAARQMKPVENSTTDWKKFKHKKAVQRSLIPAQSYLCAYCEIELSREQRDIGYHIEHILPKSDCPRLTFEFTNLLISCFTSGGEISSSDDDPTPISCGHASGKKSGFDISLFIRPTEENCERYFFYELFEGLIAPNPELIESIDIERANYTIDLLNLNCRRLQRKRKDIFKKGLEIINDLSDSPDALSNFAISQLEKINNKHRSFITTRRQYFADLIEDSRNFNV